MAKNSPLIVFSHLRWDFVYQRPQQILSRLAKHRPIIFIEEPVPCDTLDVPHWTESEPSRNVTVMVPKVPSAQFTSDFENPALIGLLERLAVTAFSEPPTVWLYTPSAIGLLDVLRPGMVVYDCMDELSAFLNAPEKLRDQEKRLLARADLVFTGGPSLFRAKRGLNPEVYCFPSSVDAAHFRSGSPVQPLDQANIPSPRLGFFGVIDERLDVVLLAQLARERPDWQIILIGPVVKIDPASLPVLPNIHYLGSRSYLELPDYIRGWDVCLMPFALNEATKFISPTKVLEYMAAQKPIVSTPIVDVVEPYGDIVRIGNGPDEFIRCCEEALQPDRQDWQRRTAATAKVVASTSWDQTARAIATLMEEKSAQAVASSPGPRVVIAGAGPTGLSAAYHLGEQAVLVEKEDRVGGWCRSTQVDGFTFDFAGHIMFSSEPYVHQMYKVLLGDNVHWQEREAWIRSYGVYTRYPFQGSLYGLPADVIQDCLVGAIESRYGSIEHRVPTPKPNGVGASQMERNGTCVKDCCADGLLEAETPSAVGEVPEAGRSGEPANFEEFIYRVWGAGIAKHFAVPYNQKLWAVPLAEMETSWLGGRVPMPNLQEMIEGSLKPSVKPMGPNARFGYPLRGGFQALMNGFLPHIKGRVLLDTKIVAIKSTERIAELSDGRSIHYDHLISTMPLPTLVGLVGKAAPAYVHTAAAKLRNVSVRCVNIGVGRERLTDKHWIYYPGDTVFHRIFVQGNASPHCNPPGGFGLTCEITYSDHKPLPCDGQELIDLAIEDCIRVGLFNADDKILTSFQVDMPYAYVVYDHRRKAAVQTIRDWMETQHISLAGRYSEWEYYNSDHAFIAGRNAALAASQDVGSKSVGQIGAPSGTDEIVGSQVK